MTEDDVDEIKSDISAFRYVGQICCLLFAFPHLALAWQTASSFVKAIWFFVKPSLRADGLALDVNFGVGVGCTFLHY